MKIAGTLTLPCLLSAALLIGLESQAQRHDRNHYHHRSYNRYSYSYPVRTYPVRVERVVYNYHPRHVIPYRGHSYYYDDGYFYRPYGAHVQVVVPPVGIRVNILPRGYRPVYIGSHVFFHFNGVFYRHLDNDYEVVRAPIGAEVPELPRGADVIVIDGQKYYEYNDNYYKERLKQNGEIWYEVVGKDGRLQTDRETEDIRLGSVVTTLPSGSKVVVINNEKYYVSPGHVYYQELIENNQILYKVTGLPQEE